MEDLLQPLPVLWVRLSSCRTRLTTTSSAPTSKAPHCGRRALGACTRSRIRFGTSCARPLVERDQLQKLCGHNSQENLWPHLGRFSCSPWLRILPSTWNVSDGLPTQLLSSHYKRAPLLE